MCDRQYDCVIKLTCKTDFKLSNNSYDHKLIQIKVIKVGRYLGNIISESIITELSGKNHQTFQFQLTPAGVGRYENKTFSLTFKMVACYRMSSQILNKVSRSTLLRQRCSQFSTSQYRNGGGGGTTGKSEIP